MSEPARDAALILLSIAYLGGAVLMLVALTKVLLAWSTSWRPDKDDGGPVDLADLREQAAAAMTAVASHARAATPAVDVVDVLGAPVHGRGGPAHGQTISVDPESPGDLTAQRRPVAVRTSDDK